jgi:uncharacterized protein involved in exopolysaccharide biosynthesis
MRQITRPRSPDDLAAMTLWQAVNRRRGRLALLMLAAGALAYGFLSMLTPQYTSTAEVLITRDGQFAAGVKGTAASPLEQVSEGDVLNQVAVIASPDLLARVARELQLEKVPEFNAALRPETLPDKLLRAAGFGRDEVRMNADERVLKRLIERLEVRPVASSHVITIEAASVESRLAATIANKVAETYIAWTQLGQLRKGPGEAETLGGKLADLKREAEAAESELDAFRARIGTLAGQGSISLNAERVAEISAQLTAARATHSEAKSRAEVIREMLEEGEAEASPEVLKSALIQRLLENRIMVERQVAELSTTLLPGHPRMRQLSSQLSALRGQIRAEGVKIARGIEREVSVAAARERTLEASLAAMTSEAERSGLAQARLAELDGLARSKRSLYESTLDRYNDASAMRDSNPVPALAKLISTARPSALPKFPQTVPVTLAAMAAALLGGLAMIGFAHAIGGSGGRRGAAMPAPGLRLHPAYPARTVMEPRAAQHARPAARRSAIFACRTAEAVASHLQKLSRGGSCIRTLIASPDSAFAPEGPAREISERLAADGSPVILIDLSGIGEGGPGFLDLLRGTASFEDVIRAEPDGDLHRIAIGSAPAEGAASPSLASAGAVVDALQGIYQHVIIAAGPREAHELATVLAGRIDAGITLGSDPVTPDSAQDRDFLGLVDPAFEVIRYELPPAAGLDAAAGAGAGLRPAAALAARLRGRAVAG